MARLDWSRLHSKILRSSIWLEDPIVRLVWICALADSETDGTFYGSYEVLARAWNLPEAEIKCAMERLCSPDPRSTTKENEGRRIIQEDENSWRVLNKRLYNPSGEPQGASTPRVQKFRYEKRLATEATGNDSNGGNALDKSILEENRTEKNIPERESAPEKRFVPPKVEEVTAYASEKGLSLDAAYFVDFFEAKGWITGKTKMRDWRAAVRNAAREGWTIRQGTNAPTPSPNGPSSPVAPQAPSGDYRLPTGGYAAADRSWFDYKGERYFARHQGVYRNEEGFAPDGSHQQNTPYGDGAKAIAERILAPVPVK